MGSQKACLSLVRENQASDDYGKFLERILKRADILDAEAIRGVRRLVRLMQKRVNERLSSEITVGNAEATWGPFWAGRLVNSVSDVVQDLSERAGLLLGDYIARSWTLGTDLVDGSLKTTRALSVFQPAISFLTLTTLAPYSAKLITGITSRTREVIDETLRERIALGESPGEIMRQLEVDLRGQKSPWRKVAYKSEIITRTEVARVQQLGIEARMNQARQEFPELTNEGMKQIFVAVRRKGSPCPICQPYDQTVWDIDDPNKPVPPIHPNCFCGLFPYFPGISTPPRPTAERQTDASLSESSECGCGKNH